MSASHTSHYPKHHKMTGHGSPSANKPHKKVTITKKKHVKPTMTREDIEHYRLYGKWGYLRTKDCKTCNGKGGFDNGNICDSCICGSCAGEKHDCNGCDDAPSDTQGAKFSSCEEDAEGAEASDEDDSDCEDSEEESDYSGSSDSDESDLDDSVTKSDCPEFDVREFTFGSLFNYEYIDEDCGTDDDNTITYHNVELLTNIGFKKKGDVLKTLALSAARGFIICDGEECALAIV